MTRTAALWLSLLSAQYALRAQSIAAKPAFAVASIKLSEPTENGYVRWFPGGRMRAEHVPLRFLIRFAWDLPEDRITGGPKWISDEFFDIEATPDALLTPEPNNGNGQVRLMLQTLIADRFHLACHLESRELPVYVLTVAKSGLRLRQSAPGGVQQVDVTSDGSLRKFTFLSSPFSSIVRNLSGQLKQTVVDHTGLQGEFDGTLEWSADLTDFDSAGPSIFTAVRQQLGMRLQVEKTPVDVLVIDSAQRPDEN
jgi:uncharacterized protein (TIGR03435 family)